MFAGCFVTVGQVISNGSIEGIFRGLMQIVFGIALFSIYQLLTSMEKLRNEFYEYVRSNDRSNATEATRQLEAFEKLKNELEIWRPK